MELLQPGDDLAGLDTDVDLQPHQLVRTLDSLGRFDAADADVQSFEAVEVDTLVDQGFELGVGHLGVLGFVVLVLVFVVRGRGLDFLRERRVEFVDAVVLDLLEQLVGLVERARLGVHRVGLGGVDVGVDVQLRPDRLGLLGADRFEQHGDSGRDLQTVTDDLCLLVAAVLELPRLVLLDVLVAELREFDRGVAGVAHVVVLHGTLEGVDGLVDLRPHVVAHVGVGRAVEVPRGEQHRAVDEVADRPDELAVDALLEALPGEVEVLLEPAHRGEVVAQQARVEPLV